jgi:hypothetical protein
MALFSVRKSCGLFFVVLVAAAMGVASVGNAQEEKSQSLQGYITEVRSPNYIDVNGIWVTISDQTQVGIIGSGPVTRDEALPKSLHVGAYVEVKGTLNKYDHLFNAQSVEFREDANKPISGVGVIDNVISSGPEMLIQADGYKIRISSATQTSFTGGLKSLADLGTNVWVHYEGHRDEAGVLDATSAKFMRTKQAQKAAGKTSTADSQAQVNAPHDEQPTMPTVDSWIDANGKFVSLHTKVRYSDSGGYCGWHKFLADPVLEERVQRIAMKVIPAYQKQLPAGHPSKIKFAFYVVDEPHYRFDLSRNLGVVLIPKQVIERLKNDDQLAAVLADGVAWNLERQSVQLRDAMLLAEGAGAVLEAAVFVLPEAYPVGVAVQMIELNKILARMEEQRGRIAISLLADAGYDPWQAPEAWKLLEPKKLPDDLSTLKYPNRSEYQFGILSLQYSKEQLNHP